MPTVLLTGANGLIAQAILKQLLEENYRVVGIVRSIDKGVTLLKYTDHNPNLAIEVVPTYDKEGAFDYILQKYPDIESILHTASPLVFVSDDPMANVVYPAIYSTRYLLNSITTYAPNLKHFVYTSSFAAQVTRMLPLSETDIITEDTWNPISLDLAKKHPQLAYPASKTLAEKEVWKFVETNEPKFTVTTILPTAVLGPQPYEQAVLDDNNRSTSEIIVRTAKGERFFPSENVTHVDIRDVTLAHVLAIQSDKFDRQRLSLANEPTSFTDISKRVHEKYPEQFALYPHVVGSSTPDVTVDNSRTRQLLNIEWHSLDASITDTIDQLIGLYKL